jgi:hypothetical protein
MKSFFVTSLFLIMFVTLPSYLLAQAGSIELKDGSGVLISSHASIQEAFNAIPATVTQAYLIEILPDYTGATETFPIDLSERVGTSTSNTITLRPAAGNTGESIVTSISNNPVMNLNGIDFFILDGRPGGVGDLPDLLIENTISSGTSSNTINMSNAATNNVIRYCNIKNNTQGGAGPRALIFGPSASTGNDSNVVEYNNIIGGRSGIGMVGSTGILNTGNIIRSNKIYDFGFAGIWLLQNGENTLIEKNEIYQTAGVSTTAAYGINLGASGTNGANIISANRIYDIQHTSTSTSASIRGIYGTLAAGSTLNIINNFVSLTLDNQSTNATTGIHFIGINDFTANVFFNSVRIGGNQSGGTSGNVVSTGIQQSNSGAGTVLNLKNNVVLNNRTGGNTGVIHAGLNMAIVPTTLDVDYNVYFADGGAGAYPVSWAGTTFDDLSTYKSAASPNEQSTIFKAVEFISSTDLHLTGSSSGDSDLAAIPITGITEDIDGDLRSIIYPYRGADEADVPIPVELTNFTANVSHNSVSLKWSTATELNNYGFDIERKIEDSNWDKTGFVPGYGTTSEIKNYSFIDNNLTAGRYNYRIKQIDYNGSFNYHYLSETIEVSIPEVFDLAQNYPNPFNPTTNIKYSVSNEKVVKLTVLNSIGQEIAVLVNESQQPGVYIVNFNGSSLSSGVYFYKLTAGDFVSTRKMLMVK